ncbi:MAG TPA: hypothetical protein VF192_01410 [Longimicrobiales bacterium]
MSELPPPPPVPCDGCGTPVPYTVGSYAREPETCYGESVRGWLGVSFIRTCWERACVRAAREKRGAPGPPAKPYDWPEPKNVVKQA